MLKKSVTPLTQAKIEGILGSFSMLVVMIIGLSASLAVPIPLISLFICYYDDPQRSRELPEFLMRSSRYPMR